MSRYLVRRLVQLVPLLLGISILCFTLIMSAPGDPVVAMYPPDEVASVDLAELHHRLGLDEPIPVQYVKMMGSLLRGDLESFQERRPALKMVVERLPTTVTFAVLAVFFGLLVGVPIGLVAARKVNSWFDNLVVSWALMWHSIPSFVLALVLMLIFCDQLHLLPPTGVRPIDASGWNLIQMFPYLIMPTFVLAGGLMPAVIRFTRSSTLEVIRQDYVRTARSKGLSERVIATRHILKNALMPVVTVVGTAFPALLGGAVLVETIFALPGMGRLAVTSALKRDYPVVMTINVLSATLVVVSGLLIDIAYALLDPRIRQG